MMPVTVELEKHDRDLTLPVVIIVGGDDQVTDVDRQSKRLHRELPSSELIVVYSMAHMIQHLALSKVVATIDRAAEQAREAT
ncbi:alpha/beta fold hydrolase [Methylobacterium mesophilicum]|nr:alpha/beta hydrolase [Methylobacterium sp. WL18]